ncbi:MAG: Ig-like domain-containing protein, partial [Cellvibrionaceae bacterium]|nr:Ig-like domain-containing protein [Cellvibrionaceae bacterium]
NRDEILELPLSATIEPSDTLSEISISDGNNTLQVAAENISVSGNGQVTVSGQDLSGLADGELTVTLVITDIAGNVGQVSDTITKDTLVSGGGGEQDPDLSIAVTAISDDTGVDGDFYTSDTTLTISGELSQPLLADERVEVSADGETWHVAVVDGNSWQFDDATEHGHGQINYQVRVIDSAGNIGATGDKTITIDTQAPGSQEGDVHSIVFDGGGDDVTNLDESFAIGMVGQIEASDTINSIVISDGNSTINVDAGDIALGEDGQVVVSGQDLSSLDDGELSITLSITDLAGNVGEVSDTITKDTLVSGGEGANDPDVSIEVTGISNDTGVEGDFISSDTILTISGEVSQALLADERVEISLDGETWFETELDGNSWQYSDPTEHSDGEISYQVRIIDSAGNIGASGDKTITIDTRAPGSDAGDIHQVSGEGGGDELISKAEVGSFEVSATIEPGDSVDSVEISDGLVSVTVPAEDISVSETGQVTIVGQDLSKLNDGELTITLTISDVAGNIGSVTDTITKDTVVSGGGDEQDPDLDIAITAISDDTNIDGDFVSSDTTLTVSGSLSENLRPDERVEISSDGETWVSVDVSDTSWSYQDPTEHADGEVEYQVRVIDGAGNVGASGSQTVVVDTMAPGSQDGDVHAVDYLGGGDELASASEIEALTLSATIDPSDTIESVLVSDGRTSILIDEEDISVAEDGSVSIASQDLSSFRDGEISVTLTIKDLAGNIGEVKDTIVKDSVVSGGSGSNDPDVTIAIESISEDTGTAGDYITSDTTLTVSGSVSHSLQTDERIEVSLDGETWHSASVEGRDWQYTDPTEHSDGQINYQVRIVDNAGNVGASTEQSVSIDTSAPDSESHSIEIMGGGDELLSSSEVGALELTASIDPSDRIDSITISDGSETLTVDSADISFADDGSVTIAGQDLSALADGELTVTLNISDSAGNVGAVSDTISKDTRVSGGEGANDPDLNISVSAISEDSGTAADDFITSDTSLTISGSLSSQLQADERLEISLDGESWAEVSVDDSSWSYQDPSEHSDGQLTYQLRVIDTAGNVGATAEQAVTIDTMAPGSQEGDSQAVTFSAGGDEFINYGESSATGLVVTLAEGDSLSEVTISDGSLSLTVSEDDIVVAEDGSISIIGQDLQALADGQLTATATIIDIAGNVGEISSTISKDTLVSGGDKPSAAAVTIQVTAISEDTGTADDFITSDNTLTVSGTIRFSQKKKLLSSGIFFSWSTEKLFRVLGFLV